MIIDIKGDKKMDFQTWAEIRRLKELEKLSEREIAQRLSISRGKVRRALFNIQPSQQGKRIRISKLDAFKPAIDEILREYPKLSGTRILEKLKVRGYPGGKTILRDYLKELRGVKREAYVRYETAPAEEAQVDWGYFGTLLFAEGESRQYSRKIYFFVMVLSYSRKLYVEFTTSQSLESFLGCHLKAFKYFGGVPKRILYDNLKSVVIRHYVGHIQYNQRFLEFSGYYLFEPKATGVAKPHEKGKVESGVGYVEKNFLAGREFIDFEDLELQAWEWQENTANRRIHGTTGEIPDERFLKEKEHLTPLQPNDYDPTVPIELKAYHDCFLKFDGNYYSVPSKYILLPLIVRVDKYQIKIFHRESCIAIHKRSYNKNQRIEDPQHFKELLKIKKAARDSKLRDRFLALAPCCSRYFEGLLNLEKDLKAELREIMQQVNSYGIYEVIPAIEKALEHKAFGAAYVKNIIAQNRAQRKEKIITPLRLSKYPEIESLEVLPKSLACYDQLLTEKEGENNV